MPGFSCVINFSYLQSVGIAPPQSAETAFTGAEVASPTSAHEDSVLLDPTLLNELWQQSNAGQFDLAPTELAELLLRIGQAHNYGQPQEATPSPEQRSTFLRALRLPDLALAHACAQGNPHAWEHFYALYREPLIRAAIAITGSDTLGRDLAESLYAELYGLTIRDGQRRCPLESYKGRGSLIGWLRTTLAQRHIDHHRRSHGDLSLEETSITETIQAPEPSPQPASGEIAMLSKALKTTLHETTAEDRFLLAAYYLDCRTLLQIAQLLHVHEATISRRLHKLTHELRKQVLRNLQNQGLSKRAAQEALGADPRDLDLNLRKLLQYSQTGAFQEKADR